MNVLVTGGAGYIGSHVVLDLLDSGHRVTVLDDLSLGFEKNVDVRAEFIKGSILCEEDLKTAFSTEPTAVVHLAAWKAAGESMVDPEKYSTNNIVGTLKLLKAMAGSGVQKMVFSSSAAVYGYPEYLPVDEKHPTDPINYYGYTKLAIEENLRWYSRLKGISFVALRYFNAAGYDSKNRVTVPEQNPQNLLPIVMEVSTGKRDKIEIFGDDYNTADGTCLRDYIHVSDLATAHTKSIQFLQQEEKDLTVNLGTGYGHTVLDVIREAKIITQHPIPYEFVERRAGDPEKLIASFEMAADILKWSPIQSDLNQILQTMWEVLHPNTTKSELIQ